jgi:hypothetical protein
MHEYLCLTLVRIPAGTPVRLTKPQQDARAHCLQPSAKGLHVSAHLLEFKAGETIGLPEWLDHRAVQGSLERIHKPVKRAAAKEEPSPVPTQAGAE